jgi:hypothetical protein
VACGSSKARRLHRVEWLLSKWPALEDLPGKALRQAAEALSRAFGTPAEVEAAPRDRLVAAVQNEAVADAIRPGASKEVAAASLPKADEDTGDARPTTAECLLEAFPALADLHPGDLASLADAHPTRGALRAAAARGELQSGAAEEPADHDAAGPPVTAEWLLGLLSPDEVNRAALQGLAPALAHAFLTQRALLAAAREDLLAVPASPDVSTGAVVEVADALQPGGA